MMSGQRLQVLRDPSLVRAALVDILGESSGSAVVFYLGGDEVLSDAARLEGGLRGLFGAGTNVLMRKILTYRE